MITEQQLKQIAPNCKIGKELVVVLNQILPKYNINTPLRLAHFFSQYAHETMGFTKFVENTNYTSPNRLRAIFPRHFPSKTIAANYAGKPQAIANKVYANRFGNGSEQSGDGYRYRGRGLCHLTFKANYYQFTLETGVEAIRHPELLEEPFYAVMAGCWYWQRRKINALADADNVLAVTRAINGGTNGIVQRKALLLKCKEVFGC